MKNPCEFLRAPAWGQAGSKGGGVVTVDASMIAADKEPKESKEDDTVVGGVLQKGTSDRGAAILDRMARSRRPNPRMIGPEWAK